MASGGKREGAGRKTLADPRDKKVQITVTIHPHTKVMIEEMKQERIRIGKIVDDAVKGIYERWSQGADLTNLK